MHVRTHVHVRISCCRALIRLVAAATIRERRLFRSALAQVRLLFESGIYSREASIRSYTVADEMGSSCGWLAPESHCGWCFSSVVTIRSLVQGGARFPFTANAEVPRHSCVVFSR